MYTAAHLLQEYWEVSVMRKKVLYSIQSPYRQPMEVIGFEFGKGEKSLCVVGASAATRCSRCMSARGW